MLGARFHSTAKATIAPLNGSSSQLILADGLCPKIAELLPGALHDVATLGASASPLTAITETLAQRRLQGQAVDTLHVVAHGRPGAFQIGGQWVDSSSLIANAEQLAQWQVSTIALWSCQVGADRDFLALLEELTGARVWASSTHLGRHGETSHWSLVHPNASEIPAAPWNREVLESWPYQLATYTFSRAYQVTNEAGKETNFHTFNSGAPLPGVTISDGSSIREFSGNDISAQAVVIGGVTYYGWVSRPIKVGGQVVGFYFWTDLDFTSLALAQADGNADADGSTADNLGFVLVVAGKESFFTSGGIGSSSDRVDSALNSLLPPPNTAPVAVADVANGTPGNDGGAALEAGGVNNGTAGFDATGNVLTNDTDADSGDTKRVSSASGANGATTSVASSTTSANGTVLIGQYGTLTIGADGTYSYVVDNDNSTVQALRTSANTLSDVFTYTMVDTAGASSTTTLTVVVQGANDAPDANNDTNTAKESLIADGTAGQYVSGTDPLGATATGNVLPNDTDVDSGDTKTVTGATITGSATSTGSSAGSGVTTLSFSSLPNNVSVGYYVFLDDGTLNNSGRGALLTTAGGTPIQITSIDTVNKTFTLSGTPSTTINNGDFLGFANTTGGAAYRDAQVSGVGSSATSIINLSGVTGTIAVGMTVQGTGLPTDPVITAVTYSGSSISSITIDQTLSGSLTGPLTFSGFSAAGSLLTGAYGTLLLNSDGSYTYTPFAQNAALNEGESATETFTYAMRDTDGLTDTATLTITVLGSGSNDPNAVADVADGTPGTSGGAAVEAGGVNNGTAGFNATGNVLTNDTTPAGTTGLTVSGIANLSTNTFSAFANGLYGSIVIGASGAYVYTIDDNNPTVQALNIGETLTETFQYQVTNNQGLFDVTTLTITINGANDAPVAVNDNGIAVENGGSPSAPVAGFNPSGDVLDNDSDVDNTAAQLSVSGIRTGTEASGSGTAGTVGTALVGTYGSLTINSDGTWTYTVDQADPDVNALAPGEVLSESFTYTVSDAPSGGLSDTAQLTITINGADDSVDINDVVVNEGSPSAVFTLTGQPGVAVTLSLENVTTTGLSGLQYYNGSSWVNYTGTPVLIGDTGSLLVRTAITPEQETDLDGPESFTLTATVVGGSSSRGTGTIVDDGTGTKWDFSGPNPDPNNNPGIPSTGPGAGFDDDRAALSVTGGDYNEASDAAFFSVTAPQGQPLTLTVLPGDTNLTAGGQPPIRYSTDGGATWQTYTGPFTVPANGTGSVLVAVDITSEQDDIFEGRETFSLSATSGGNTAEGDATINDDGTGTIIPVDPDGDPTIDNGNPVIDPDGPFDDDRAPLSVTGGDYNEASDAAFFSVTAPQGQPLTLTVLPGDTNLTAGGQPPIRYSTDGGATWQTYTGPFTVPANGTGSVLVAVDITSEQDDVFEGRETFSLSATSGGNTAEGDATINDDGTGTIIPVDADGDPTVINGNPVTDPDGPFDDDRAGVSVTGGDYNEASDAAFFFVTAPQGQPLTLTVLPGDTNLTAGGQPPIRYSTDGGATWQTYTGPFTVPANGTGSVLVAVDITSEQDDIFEGRETFSLSATSGGNTASGNATINDDGTGTIIPVDADGDPTVINGNPVTDPDGPFDDDRAGVSVTGGNYNEASDAAFFFVTAPQGQPLTLTVLPGDTNLTAGGQPPIRYSTDGGATWQTYTGPFTVPANGTGSVLVAVDITSEQDDVFEGRETFSLSATSGGNTASGNATINDDGTGTIIPVDADGDPTVINGNPVTDPDGPFDDDRAGVSVTGGNYNEASDAAFFFVTAPQGQPLTLTVLPGDTNLTAGGQPPIRYSTDGGATWQTYTGPFTVPANGTGSVLVAVDITSEQDDVFEGREIFSLSATSGGNTASGNATINDDGTGTIIPVDADGDPTVINGNPVTDPDGPFDDDSRPTGLNMQTGSDSGTVTDLITADGKPQLQIIGAAGRSSKISLQGANGETLVNGQNYAVREVALADRPGKAVYVIDLIDADLSKPGNQSFGSYFMGVSTGNSANNKDGTYTILFDGLAVDTFKIKTSPLSEAKRLNCLNKIYANRALESTLYGYRTEKTVGTNGDDILIGRATESDTLKGLKGSDLLNGFGDRLTGTSLDPNNQAPQVDTLIGGKGADSFQLGDIVGSFYSQNGRNDHALIQDFDKTDNLILQGSADQYALSAVVNGCRELSRDGDLIALIKGSGISGIDLADASKVSFL